MRLISKITLYYLGIAIVVFTLGGVITYNLISQEIAKETDYYLAGSLPTMEEHIARAIRRGRGLERFNSNQVEVREVFDVTPYEKPIFSDTVAMHPHINQMETMRKLKVVKEVEGKLLEIIMIDVFVEDSDIYESVVKIITRLFILLALAMLIGSFFVARTTLNPFKSTLERVKEFTVQDEQKLNLPKTRIREFSDLNLFLNQMADRAQQEYQSLKKFSEDASHEIQTPLAIAQGKLDLLADQDNLNEEQFRLVAGTQNALSRLSQVSRSLALLTKIENEEFDAREETNVSSMVNETLDHFKELFQIKGLDIREKIEGDITLPLNRHLGTILLNNLLHNAIKHNQKGGYVNIELTQKGLKINNSGKPPAAPPEQMFNRFEKDPDSTDSNGLGLAIAKEICDYHNLEISYTFDEDHEIAISF